MLRTSWSAPVYQWLTWSMSSLPAQWSGTWWREESEECWRTMKNSTMPSKDSPFSTFLILSVSQSLLTHLLFFSRSGMWSRWPVRLELVSTLCLMIWWKLILKWCWRCLPASWDMIWERTNAKTNTWVVPLCALFSVLKCFFVIVIIIFLSHVASEQNNSDGIFYGLFYCYNKTFDPNPKTFYFCKATAFVFDFETSFGFILNMSLRVLQ